MVSPKKLKAKGTRFEYRVRDWLEQRRWNVFRSAGSYSPVDLIGLRGLKQVVLVQCKATLTPELSDDEYLGLAYLQSLGFVTYVICRGDHNELHFYVLIEGTGAVRVEEPKWIR